MPRVRSIHIYPSARVLTGIQDGCRLSDILIFTTDAASRIIPPVLPYEYDYDYDVLYITLWR
jgi:hypothetical protein